MKKIKNLLFVVSLFISGAVICQGTETRKLASFGKLKVSGSLDVVAEQGSDESARIVAEGVDPKKIITEVKDGALEVYLEKGDYHNIKTTVYITYKKLNGIDRAGSGNITCKSDLSGPDFSLNSSGSGNVNINGKIKAQQIHLNRSGSGNMKVSSVETDDIELSFSGSGNFEIAGGYAKKQDIRLVGSGNVSAYALKSETCTASISGSGNISVSVSKSLEGKIAGSGNINYKGDAKVNKIGIMGSGKISRREG